MNFEIGKEVIALKAHSQGLYKKDDIFVLKNMSNSVCKCGRLHLDIGFRLEGFLGVRCVSCGQTCDLHNNTYWLAAINFAPLDDIVTIEEILEKLEEPELA